MAGPRHHNCCSASSSRTLVKEPCRNTWLSESSDANSVRSASPMQAAAAVMEWAMNPDEPSAAASPLEVADDIDTDSLADVMCVVPLGAGVLAGSAVALLVLG